MRAGETIAYVAAGEGHTCAVTSKGRTLAWGQSTWMEPYNITALDEQNVVSVSLISNKIACRIHAYIHT
jgi:alpha-tubulin suppressor-like RCC1 family protein